MSCGRWMKDRIVKATCVDNRINIHTHYNYIYTYVYIGLHKYKETDRQTERAERKREGREREKGRERETSRTYPDISLGWCNISGRGCVDFGRNFLQLRLLYSKAFNSSIFNP